MQIAIVGNQARSAINFRGPLIRYLVELGHSVLVLAPDFDVDTRKQIAALGAVAADYDLDRTGSNPFKDLMALYQLCRILRQGRFDAVLAYFAKPVIYAMPASVMGGVARRVALIEGAGLIFTEGGAVSAKRRFIRAVMALMYRVALKSSTATFVLNQDDRRLFEKIKGKRGAPIACLPGIGIDLDFYGQVEPSKSRPCPMFCLPARMIEEKGVRFFVEAAGLLRKKYPQVRFVLLGGLEESPSAIPEADLAGWAQEGIVEWVGYVPDIRGLLGNSLALVLPTYYREGLPRSILEAMSLGRAVIATDVPGCRDAVEDGVTGQIVPPKDASRLAAAIERYICQPALAEAHGKQGRLRAEKLYDVDDVNKRIAQALGAG
ncbi:glycoprotein 3-alpha-L-fucosyltransferase [Salinisphaera shabanensis E1L3A]|uniref:Glycoprotein 3-alpha-L-fucosyltransferase n=1 Tax=Salinisphaera shabanensis E1L3A TaxID=1033802 RepID=U2E0U2_9GAMM|nr:glycosyltransferase family 4 protein [Salinisphaera shabanensis]ERJ17536.1 glycoprotein 3-alpha-L-fucosyltransferase [Salinisphaera shabanensis E1L3A]